MIDLAMSQSHLRHKFIFQYIMVFMSKTFHAHFLCTNIWVHLTKNMLCETEKKQCQVPGYYHVFQQI